MKVWTICFTALFIFTFPLNTFAKSENSSLKKLTEQANHIYEAISNSQLDTAENYLSTFKKSWEKISQTETALSPVAVRTIMAQEEQLEQVLKLNVGENEINEASVEFRLAVDALVNSQHPLWMGMKDKVLSAFNKVEQDVQSGDDRAFQVDLNQFQDVYQMVYPSLTIDVKSDVLKELDGQINHIINNRMTIVQNKSNHLPHLNEIHDKLSSLFGGTEPTSGFIHTPELFTPSIFIGGLVILTLLYVVWRKYKGEDETKAQVSVTKQ